MGIKKIAITGNSGFIGSNLVKLLTKKHIPFVLFKGDLLDIKNTEKFFRKNKPETVVHLVGKFFGSKQELEKINVETTKNLLSVAIKNGMKKIIYTSTGGVYGEPKHKTGSKESDKPNPNTDYAKSKLKAEKTITQYEKKYNFKAIILRFPNVYGPGSKQGVIHDLLESIRKNKSVTIFGTGEQKRQFIHVSDALQAMVKAITFDKSSIFNITNQKSYSLKKIINLLQKNYSFSISYKPSNNYLQKLALDPTKAKEKLKFEAKIIDLKI